MGCIGQKVILGNEKYKIFDEHGNRVGTVPIPDGARQPCKVCGCPGWMRLPNGDALPPKHADDCVVRPPAKH